MVGNSQRTDLNVISVIFACLGVLASALSVSGIVDFWGHLGELTGIRPCKAL